jgi:hypothetical protein
MAKFTALALLPRRMQGASAAIVVLALSLVAGRAHAQTGTIGCPCLGALPDTVARVDCDVDHAAGGQCVVADGLVGVAPLLVADFGVELGLYPIVTFQYSSTTLDPFSFHIQ